MLPLIFALIAFVICYLLLAWLLRRVDRLPLDHPNERSLHIQPVPRVGGLGVVAGVLLAMLWLRPAGLEWLLAMALFLAALSWMDDVRGLSVRLRLPAHFLAAGVFLALAGETNLLVWLPGVLVMVWMTNLYNFMDGADGLAGGMAVAGFGAYGLAAWMGGGQDVALLSLSIVGAALAFLRFNFPPARLFLGDCGSIPLGFLAAGLGWMGIRDGLWSALFPLLVFSPFIVDASVTMLARLWRGERVWRAHRSHYYQRLVRMGFSHRRLALMEYGVMAGAALSGLASVIWRDMVWEMEWGIGMAWVLFYFLVMLRIDQLWRKAGHAH
jgi:UDP-N-acetylmuramyl pentapeptide phosphotransferase/UDP-N-acetylglucosamine-1-phosphate transferase